MPAAQLPFGLGLASSVVLGQLNTEHNTSVVYLEYAAIMPDSTWSGIGRVEVE